MQRLILVVTVAAVGMACADTNAPQSDTPAAAAAVAAPWETVPVEARSGDGLRVLVLHDMEGLAGQDDWRSFNFGREQYPDGQELLVGDINAVVDGLFAAGATEVDVVDGHGSGNPAPDVRRDLLDARANQILRDTPFDTYFDVPESAAYDAVAVVGMHAKTGSGGFASHTFTLGIEFQVHGQSITETELVALSWGRFGTPVIFASGDDRLAADLATMPWIEFVTVKTATSASTAEPRPVQEARADLRAGAQRALENLAGARVMRVALPVQATLRTVPPASVAILAGVPGLDVEDDQVTFEAATLRAAYDGLVALVGVARNSYQGVLVELLDDRDLWDDVGPAYRERLMERWLDVESGRWSTPANAPVPAGGQYHGYR